MENDDIKNLILYKIYKYTSPSNKIYIGQTCRSLEQRANYGKGYIHSSYFYNAIQKYGFKNFKVEILKDNLTLEEANYWEEYFIKFYNSNIREFGYNIDQGGKNHSISEEKRKKLSERMIKNNPMKNPEIAKKVSSKNKGKIMSKEFRIKVANGHKKKIECIETGEIFNSRNEAALAYNVSPSGISRAANGEQNTSAGKHWRYI